MDIIVVAHVSVSPYYRRQIERLKRQLNQVSGEQRRIEEHSQQIIAEKRWVYVFWQEWGITFSVINNFIPVNQCNIIRLFICNM